MSARIAGPADMTPESFQRVLEDYSSPALPDAELLYPVLTYAGVRPSVFLAFFIHESRCGTLGIAASHQLNNPGNVRSVADPASGGVVIDTPRGQFVRYPTWTVGTRDWAKRLRGPLYEGAGLKTVAQVIPKYAPSSDGNDTEAYIRAVEATVKRLARDITGGSMEITKKLLSINHWTGRDGHQIRAIVLHVAEGTEASVTNWFNNPESEVSAGYLVCKDGRIIQYVDDADTAWANGGKNGPNLNNPLVAEWVRTGTNPNRETLAIETERHWNEPLTAPQLASLRTIVQEKAEQYGVPLTRVYVMGHNDLDSVNKARCPSLSEQEWRTILAVDPASAPVSDPGLPGLLQHRRFNACGRSRLRGRGGVRGARRNPG